jgi:hypothetical protein
LAGAARRGDQAWFRLSSPTMRRAATMPMSSTGAREASRFSDTHHFRSHDGLPALIVVVRSALPD